MFERELEQDEKTLATERGRSPSGVASVFGPADAPTPALAVDHPQVISPGVLADPSPAIPPVPEQPSSDVLEEVQADDAFLDEEPFPEEPFEEMRRPRLAHFAQRMESAFMFGRVVPRIMEQRPELFVSTIHDSILTTAGDGGLVRQVMLDEFAHLGLSPQVKVELCPTKEP